MMSGTYTQLAALACCWFMRRYKFEPRTLLNIGVGKTSPELAVWEWLLYPDCKLIGIDPRWSPRGYWTKVRKMPQLAVAVGDGSSSRAKYCGPCRSLLCTDPKHEATKSSVPVMSLDEIVEVHRLQGPFFMWMDIDGSEVTALRGATRTLANTGWLNIELNPAYGQCDAIRGLLADSNFVLHYKHPGVQDELYRRR